MNRLATLVTAATLAFGARALIYPDAAYAQASSVGQLRGVVKDKGMNEPAVGATVVATSPALQGEQVVITDDTGQYFVTSLPAGMYTLTVYYNDSTYVRSNVLVQVGKEAVINVTVNTAETAGKPKGEVITIVGTAPIVDQGSTKTGMTLTSDYTNNVPTGRTFGATMGAAAGSQGDTYGISFAGATSVENTYVIEGINTTDTAYGQLSSNLPNEFISETEVITGGYNAEYGRATGGIVNVVTKQGSNELHGSVFGNLDPSTFTAPARVIQAEGGSIDNQVNPGNIWDTGFELGGPIVKDKLWFHVGFDPSVANVNDVRSVQTQVDKNGDGIPDIDPATGLAQHEEVSRANVDGATKTYYFTGKLNGAVDQNNQFQVSVFGNPNTAHSPITPATNQGRVPGLTDDSIDTTGGAEDVSAKWTSKLNNGKTQIDAVVGYHHATTGATAPSAVGDQSLVFYNYTRSLSDFQDIEGTQIAGKCSDGPGDPYPMIQNCPVRTYQESGLGLVQQNTNNRSTASLSVTQRVKAGGYHVFKAGVDYEGSTYDQLGEFSGGLGSFRRSADTTAGGPGTWRLNAFYSIERNLTADEVANPGSVAVGPNETICSNGHALCRSTGTLNANTGDTSIGAYLQDSWQIMPNFTLNGGVRYENQSAGTAKQLQGTVAPTGETVGDVGFSVDNWAPRIGFVWDPTQEGKSKVFAHWGRFYENVPMDLNVRALGGEIDNIANYNGKHLTPGTPGYDPNCNVDHASVPGDLGTTVSQCSDFSQVAILGGGTEFVTPGLSGQYSDELIIGAEYEVLPDVKVGVNYVHRSLPVVIEDILSATGDYYITNPAQNFDQQAADLAQQAAAEQMSSDAATKAKGEVDAGRAAAMARIKLFDQPARNYDAVQVQLTQRPTKSSLILASYTYSKEQGNFPGLFSTETGQLDPNITSEFDLPALLANRYGALALDRPHNAKVDGFYRFDLKQAGLITVGASLRAQSGIAHNVLGADPAYGPGESYLLPRGVADRSPTTGQADIHLAYGRRLGKGSVLEVFGDVFNLTDAQQEASRDEIYTDDAAHPIVGGDMNDLEHVKIFDVSSSLETAHTPTLNPNFAHTTAYLQAPRSFRFGVRLTF